MMSKFSTGSSERRFAAILRLRDLLADQPAAVQMVIAADAIAAGTPGGAPTAPPAR